MIYNTEDGVRVISTFHINHLRGGDDQARTYSQLCDPHS